MKIECTAKRSVRRGFCYSRIGFRKGLINEAHGELTASPYIDLQTALVFSSPRRRRRAQRNRRERRRTVSQPHSARPQHSASPAAVKRRYYPLSVS